MSVTTAPTVGGVTVTLVTDTLLANARPGLTVSGATSSATTINTVNILLIMSTSVYAKLLLAIGLAADHES